MAVKPLKTRIEIEIAKAQAALKKIQAESKKTGSSVEQVGKKAKKTFGKDIPSFINPTTLALTAVTLAVKKTIGAFAELESQTVSYTVLLGSSQKANSLLGALSEFAAKTPFAVDQVRALAKQLIAIKIPQEEIVKTMKILGTVSAATGADLQRLVLNYGQVVTQGKLTTRESIDFQRNFVNVSDMIGKSAEEVRDAMEKMFPENLLDKQSKTLGGMFSNLIDSVTLLAETVGSVLSPALKVATDISTDFINGVNIMLGGGSDQRAKFPIAPFSLARPAEIPFRPTDLNAPRQARKRTDPRNRIGISRIEGGTSSAETRTDLFAQENQSRIEALAEQHSKELGMFRDFEEQKVTIVNRSEEIKQEAQQGTFEALQSLFVAADGQSRALFEVGKIAALASMAVDKGRAIVKAYGQGGIWGWAQAAALATASTLQIAKVAKIQYNSGQTAGSADAQGSFGANGVPQFANLFGQATGSEKTTSSGFFSHNRISKSETLLEKIAATSKSTAENTEGMLIGRG